MTIPSAPQANLSTAFRNLLSNFPEWSSVWVPASGILLTSVLQISCVFGYPFLNRVVFDSVLTTLDGSLLSQVTVAILLFVLFGTVFKILMDYQIAHLRSKMADILRRKAVVNLIDLEYLEVAGMERGDVVQKLVAESDSVADGLAVLFRNLAHLLQLLVITAVILFIDSSLLLLFLGVMSLFIIMALPMRGLAYRLSMQSGKIHGKLHSVLFETFPAVKVIKFENLYSYQNERLDRLLKELSPVGMKQSFLTSFGKLGFMLPIRIAHLSILIIGFWRVRSGDYTIGTFTMVFWFIDIVLDPLAKLRDSVGTLLISSASASRLSELVACRKEIHGSQVFKGLTKAIKLEGVGFVHKTGNMVLQDVSLTLPKGSKICIFGRSGAGKSTLVNLMSGLTRPTHGRILMDGVDMAHYTRESLIEHMALVSQDVFLFDDTIRRNIDLTGLIPDNIIMEACRNAELGAFLERLPLGLSTPVGERGVTMSGGERQRISLARALARGSDFLIFDEATSALDPETESRIMENLRIYETMRGPLTLVAVAHRPILAAGMDFAYVLEAGRIIGSGTLEFLAKNDNAYRRLFNMVT